jgi:hypothetical protein
VPGKAQWKIEIRTGDHEPYPEWLEVYDRWRRFRFVDREEAERMLARLRRVQPHGEFRVAPLS